MIHKFCKNGYYIVIDTYSGAVHVASAVVYDVLDFWGSRGKAEIHKELLGKYSEEELEQAFSEIEELVSEGILFSGDTYADLAEKSVSEPPVLKALCLLAAHGCNLKCAYCFAKELTDCEGTGLMSLDTGKKAVDFLLANSGTRKNLEIDFFGGEPLLNFETITEIVKYAREKEAPLGKNIRFTLTTNGLLLDEEKLSFINKEMHNIVLSLDGRREVNDSMRKTPDGRGSYDSVLPIFQKTAAARGQSNYYIRGTYTAKNLDFSRDVLHLAERGFSQISIEPVIGFIPGLSITREHVPAILEEYEKLAKIMLEREQAGQKFNFFHFNIDLDGGPCAKKRVSGCGAGSSYLAVSARGELYPCHQFAGDEEFKMGTLDDFSFENETLKKFKNCHIYSKEKCVKCWGKFYCGGGCPANAHAENGDIAVPDDIGCELQLARVECAIMMQANQMSEIRGQKSENLRFF